MGEGAEIKFAKIGILDCTKLIKQSVRIAKAIEETPISVPRKSHSQCSSNCLPRAAGLN